MKTKLLLIIFLAFIKTNAQEVYSAKPEINDSAYDFCITPNGNVWVTAPGKAYVLDHNDNFWHGLNLGSVKGAPRHITFFNDNIGIIYGFLKEGDRDYILRTQDAGKNWDKVFLPDRNPYMWVNKAYLNTDGSGWLTCAYFIYKTIDFGKTWTTIATINRDSKDLSPCDMLFAGNKCYFITCEDQLLKTADINFSKIEMAVMPSDQITDVLPNTKVRMQYTVIPDENNKLKAVPQPIIPGGFIRDFAIMGNELFVLQNHQLYYTDLKEIQWKPVGNSKYQVLAGDGKNIYAIGDDLRTYIIDPARQTKIYNNIPLDFNPWEIKIFKGVIYFNRLMGEMGYITKDGITYY